MNNNERRIINYRAFAFGGIVMLATIFFAFMCFKSLWYILPLSIILCMGIVYFCAKKSFGKLIYFCSVMILSVGVLLLSVFTYNDFAVNNQKVKFDCRVDSIYAEYDNSISIIAGDIKINDNKVSGKVFVTIYDIETVSIGDKLTFEGIAKSYDVFDLIKNNFGFYRNNIKYKVSTNADKTNIVSGKMTFVEKYKESAKSNLISIMGKDVGGVSYALLFGDKTLIDGDIYNLFKSSGTSHLLAISGLHISIIIGLVYFLIKKLKVKNIFKFLIMFGFLVLYCYLCDFAISVCRASIMGLVMIGSKLFGKRYDSLNALGFAGMIILMVSPLSIFSAGFLLSFVAVLSIILFSKTFDKIKFRSEIVRKILTTMFVTFIVTIFTYPITASFYREVALYSVFANLIIIPLFSVAFVCVFSLHLLSYIGLGFLLYIPKIIFEIVFAINNFFARLPFATLKVAGVSIIVAILIYLILFVISRFVMLKIKIKAVSCFIIFVLCATIMLEGCINRYNTSYVCVDNYSYSAIFVNQNNAYLISPKLSSTYAYNTKMQLREKDILFLDGIVFTKEDEFEVKLLQNFMKDFGNPTIYVPKGHIAIANLKSSLVTYVEYDDGINLQGNIYLNINKDLTNIVVCDTCFAFASRDYNIVDFDGVVDYLIYDGQQQNGSIKIINDTQYIKLG